MNAITGNSSRLKELNTERVREALKKAGSATKLQLAQATGLSVATCGNILAGLLATGEVTEESLLESSGGRPARTYAYDFRYSMLALLHLGKESGIRVLTCTVADAAGRTVERKSKILPQITLDVIANALKRILQKYPAVKVAAVSYPGVVNDGVIDPALGDLEELFGCDLKGGLEQCLPLKVSVENDMNLAALGYFRNHNCPPESSLSYLAFFDQILPGCGSIINGRLTRGSRGFAGEVTWLPFGSTPEKLYRELLTRPGAVRQISRTILTLTAVLNPDTVVLCGKMFVDHSLQQEIADACRKPSIEAFLPELVFAKDWMDDIMAGLRECAMELLRCPIRLIRIEN